MISARVSKKGEEDEGFKSFDRDHTTTIPTALGGVLFDNLENPSTTGDDNMTTTRNSWRENEKG
jgi:hypothetical protein